MEPRQPRKQDRAAPPSGRLPVPRNRHRPFAHQNGKPKYPAGRLPARRNLNRPAAYKNDQPLFKNRYFFWQFATGVPRVLPSSRKPVIYSHPSVATVVSASGLLRRCPSPFLVCPPKVVPNSYVAQGTPHKVLRSAPPPMSSTHIAPKLGQVDIGGGALWGHRWLLDVTLGGGWTLGRRGAGQRVV